MIGKAAFDNQANRISKLSNDVANLQDFADELKGNFLDHEEKLEGHTTKLKVDDELIHEL